MASLLDARLLYCLCSVRTKKDYNDPLEFVLSCGIDESLFESDAKECFQWILEQAEIEDTLPSVAHLARTFKGIDFTAAKKERDQLKELVEEFKSAKAQECLAEAISELVNRPKQASAHDLVDLLDEVRAKIPLQYRTKSSLKDDENIEKLVNYRDHTVVRIPQPWDCITKVTGGYELGSLSAFVAPPGSGKTFLSCINAHYLMQQGLSVGLVSLEDPEWRLNYRLWSIVGKVSPTSFSDGLVGPKRIKRIVRTLKKYPGDLVVYTNKDIPDLRKVERVAIDAKHDVIIIDAVYLLDCGKKTFNDFENIQKTIRGLAAMAEKLGIAVIVTSQYGSAGVKVRTAGFSIDDINTDGIRYGKELEMSCAFLAGFFREQQSTIGQIKILKVRESREDCTGMVCETNWNVQNSNFDEIGFRGLDNNNFDGDDDGFEATY